MPHCTGVPFCVRVTPSAEPVAVARVALKHHYLANVATIIEEAHADDPVVAAVAGQIAPKVFAQNQIANGIRSSGTAGFVALWRSDTLQPHGDV